MAELEAIVERLEQGDLSLEDSLQQFERGVVLTRSCQAALKQAEQRVKVLSAKPGAEPVLEDFEPEDSDGPCFTGHFDPLTRKFVEGDSVALEGCMARTSLRNIFTSSGGAITLAWRPKLSTQRTTSSRRPTSKRSSSSAR